MALAMPPPLLLTPTRSAANRLFLRSVVPVTTPLALTASLLAVAMVVVAAVVTVLVARAVEVSSARAVEALLLEAVVATLLPRAVAKLRQLKLFSLSTFLSIHWTDDFFRLCITLDSYSLIWSLSLSPL